MSRLVRLYPRAWRDRYGEEFSDLIAARSGRHSRLYLVWDIGRGALAAHLFGRYGMRRLVTEPALRRGLHDGLIISGLCAIIIALTNVVYAPSPDRDIDSRHRIWLLALLGVLALLLAAAGARGRRRAGGVGAGARAGTAAGALLATMVTLTYIAVNNLFLATVSQQYDKRIGFAASGWTSMRAYLTITQLRGALIVVPVAAIVGAILGLLGGMAFPPRTVNRFAGRAELADRRTSRRG